MARPQPTDAHLRVAHSINEAIMLRDFTKRQRKILDLILRLSWGCGKKTAIIPRQKDFMVVGIAESHISAEVKWLQDSKIITTDGQNYNFNKDFDQWQVSRVRPFQPDKLTELVRMNVNGTSQNGKNELTELVRILPETVSPNLLKQEVLTSQNSKIKENPLPLTPSPPIPPTLKERLKKEGERERKEYGEFNNVLLSDEKYQELCNRFSKHWTDNYIEQLSGYMQQSNANAKKYTDHFATLRNWLLRDGRSNGTHQGNNQKVRKQGEYSDPDQLRREARSETG
jgi:hypothetical protein